MSDPEQGIPRISGAGPTESVPRAPANPAAGMPDPGPDAPAPNEPEVLAGRPGRESSLWRWRGPISLVAAVLCAVFGILLVWAADAHGGDDSMENARPAELVAILDSLENDINRLENEKRSLESELDALASGTSKEALAKSRERLAGLQVLAGTTPVRGPGVVVKIGDPQGGVDSGDVLDAIQELRDAGAESIEFAERRVVVDTWFSDVPASQGNGILVSGDTRKPPYVIKAIGDPETLSTAMQIPGGVADTMRTAGATFTLDTKDSLDIESTVPLEVPEYAEPATGAK